LWSKKSAKSSRSPIAFTSNDRVSFSGLAGDLKDEYEVAGTIFAAKK
jgi:hypothetical protein